jgi:hypothetical protein
MRNDISDLLRNFRSLDQLKRLFWQELNYDRVNTQLPIRDWSANAPGQTPGRPAGSPLQGDLLLLAEHGDFKIIYGRMAGDLSRTAERTIVNRLLQNYPYALFVFSNNDETHWHFVNVKYDRDTSKRRIFRRITVEPGERLRTAAERLSMLDLETISRDLFGIAPLAIQQRHDQAFDVEAVTRAFYDDYHKQFKTLQNSLEAATNDRAWAHDYALQFINRVMFVYFVQRKRWLNNDSEFLASFWKEYKTTTTETDRFVADWLQVLFFEAFNNRFAPRLYFSAALNNALVQAPYLNGGLFRENELDRKYEIALADDQFESLFTMLEKYNFTIREDSPLDQEVAVDPEMIGKVYESLVNVSTEADERGEIGIFYTPRTEIDLMCRLALVDHLSRRLGEQHHATLYEFVFAVEPQVKQHVDDGLVPQNLWQPLSDALRSLTVIDPACGSGAFLVGMLTVLDDLNERANRRIGIDETPSERRRRIIRDSLYGVDVMGWAVDIAELRLWLQLVVETDYNLAELKLRPLLPDLSFKVRQGDSLVQEVAGINLRHIHGSRDVPPHLKGRITQLKAEKFKSYQNAPLSQRKFKTTQAIRDEELAIFREVLAHRVSVLEQRVKDMSAEQTGMFAVAAKPSPERNAAEAELAQARVALDTLHTVRDVPFVWEIAFVEIFKGDRGGFDIVVGNPPYVRQEWIKDPLNQTTDKKRYKGKLARSVYERYPAYFGLNQRTGKTSRTLSSKSDLYIYFFFHGLSLLNDQGSFCFVTSNSWLDVGYGADLQEFLLRQGHVRLMIDNKSRRTFANADVNSVIALLGPVQDARQQRDAGLNKTARFVLFAVPFEEALDASVWKRVEAVTERTVVAENGRQQCRVYPVAQKALLEDGIAASAVDDEENKQHKAGEYAGNKWGGKYLRAPDIYYTLLERGKGKLKRLGDKGIAQVRRGYTTGANEFFFLNKSKAAQWQIEDRYLVPALKSPREATSIVLNSNDFETMLFMCHDSREQLRGTAALEYIRWGEQQGYDQRPSCRTRPRWWDVGKRAGAHVNCNYLVDRVMRCFCSPEPFFVGDNFQEIYSDLPWQSVAVSTNATLTQLMINTLGRTNFGDGLLKIHTYEVANLEILSPSLIDVDVAQQAIEQAHMLHVEGNDRRALDAIIFDILGLTQGERDAVYEAVIDLVDARLKKAASFKMIKAVEE